MSNSVTKVAAEVPGIESDVYWPTAEEKALVKASESFIFQR